MILLAYWINHTNNIKTFHAIYFKHPNDHDYKNYCYLRLRKTYIQQPRTLHLWRAFPFSDSTLVDWTAETKGLKALFDIASLQQTSYRDLQSYLNKVEAHYGALQVLKQPTADTVLLYLLISKLDHFKIKGKGRKHTLPNSRRTS